MEQCSILIGFDEPTFEKDIVKCLKSMGIRAQTAVKLTKNSIREYIQSNPGTDAVVLLEVLNGSGNERVSRYTADELAALTDESDINVVVLLEDDRKGTEFMQVLYGAGILSAVFPDKKNGVTAKTICNLIVHKRTRAAAREYYGLREKLVALDFLGDDTFTAYYNFLLDDSAGNPMYERFYKLCQWMTDGQIADFLRRLPPEDIAELGADPEFYPFCRKLGSTGIPIHISKPRKTAKPSGRGQREVRISSGELRVEKAGQYRNSMQVVLVIAAALAIGLVVAGILLNVLT